MRNKIKALYKKDPELARQVAKVLGYKIKVKAESPKDRLYTIKDLKDLVNDYIIDLEAYGDNSENEDLKLAEKILMQLIKSINNERVHLDELKKAAKKFSGDKKELVEDFMLYVESVL